MSYGIELTLHVQYMSILFPLQKYFSLNCVQISEHNAVAAAIVVAVQLSCCDVSVVWCDASVVWCDVSVVWCDVSVVWCDMTVVWCDVSVVWKILLEKNC